MLTIGICGICGKVGQSILQVLLEKGHTLGAAFEYELSPHIGKNANFLAVESGVDVVINTINQEDIEKIDGIIDFSNPEATLNLLDIAKKQKKPMVIGTTGFSDNGTKQIEDASNEIPIVFSPNMSLGVNILFRLTEIATKILAKDFDIEIFEAHHRFKKDAPSGTAKKLLEIVKNSAADIDNPQEIYDRSKTTVMREDNEIGMMSLRGGDIVGDHTVFFAGKGERIELTHRATSRENFAKGAVLAMEFVSGSKPGLYSMFDVLGI